ncbi:unnamed protein product [Danaus chrysippus]|uniref:(African queen) hypothetical protein n=1 Tax=Danaus chrysippus TaxID=151541 RepID=A0A8J2W9S4_9NEOP|nr:unnamed protein product [Danaus chrysippus]
MDAATVRFDSISQTQLTTRGQGCAMSSLRRAGVEPPDTAPTVLIERHGMNTPDDIRLALYLHEPLTPANNPPPPVHRRVERPPSAPRPSPSSATAPVGPAPLPRSIYLYLTINLSFISPCC